MSVCLNHTIVSARDRAVSAVFLAAILGLPSPARFGPFHVVGVDNGVALDFMQADGAIAPQHYRSSRARTAAAKASEGVA